MDFGKINPVTGPVYIEGAEHGDVLKPTLLSFKPSGWGWTANIPGFGLLAEEFPDPDLHLWKYNSDTLAPAFSGGGAQRLSSLSRRWTGGKGTVVRTCQSTARGFVFGHK
jgi:acetamidase/formamidase